MQVSLTPKSRKPYNLILEFCLPSAFLIMMILLYPHIERFMFDTDEGINLMKAMLLAVGHPLYQEIWSDQPPILTHLLATAFRVFSFDIEVARFLILAFSCMLLLGAMVFLRELGGKIYAVTGFLFIIFLPHYIMLSFSVMVGLPSLAFAMISLLAMALWHRNKNRSTLIVSAVFLSLSVMTKGFTAFLVPIFVAGLILSESYTEMGNSWLRKLKPAILWTLVFLSVTFTILLIFVGPGNLSQLYISHIKAHLLTPQTFTINRRLEASFFTIILAVLGSPLMVRRRRWIALYLIAWAGIAYLLLLNHRPIWSHHQLLVTIPVAMLAACTVGEIAMWIVDFCSSHVFNALRASIFVVAAMSVFCLFNSQTPKILQLFQPENASDSYAITAKIAENSHRTKWMVTDHPIYAFRAGIPVPPNLVVISWKRLRTGNLTEDEVYETIRIRKPEQVLLGRFKWPSIVKFLEENYRPVHSHKNMRLYLRKDLL